MSGVAHNAQSGFWQRPASDAMAVPAVSSPTQPADALAASCAGCGAEFMVGAGFCHRCGSTRLPQSTTVVDPESSTFLMLQSIKRNIQQRLGLSGAPLAAFFAGIGCLILATMVGIAVRGSADSQAVEFWRIQWLLAAVAAFAAGILLKRPETGSK